MKFTKIPENTFKELQINAGVICKTFTVNTGTIGDIIGATSGGINFTATPTYVDLGDDVDNCPKNTKELKRLDSWEAKLSGTFVALNTTSAKSLVASADVESEKITPRNDLATTDFSDIWWVGDYSEKDGGYIAIHLLNGLSTGGFKIQSKDKAKGTFAFEFTGHYSIDSQDTVPFEIYIHTVPASGT